MKTISCGLWIILCLASSYRATGLSEHKVHNIVLYPDKHSWCKTTGIKQIVAYPGCSSIEIDNNVCVGACFSYSIPRTIPSAPGEVITPYCDSCQPVDYEWKEVTLTCSDESEEDEGQTEMTKKVQVITNCTCTACEKQYEQKKMTDHHKHIGGKTDDVPELMSLMMETHHTRKHVKESEEEETTEDSNTESSPDVSNEKITINTERNLEKDNLVEEDGDEELKRTKNKSESSQGIEILHMNQHSSKMDELITAAKIEHQHYEIGPHHSLILKPDVVDKEPHVHHHVKHDDDDDEKTPSLLENQFKIHDNEEYLDQVAVESVHKDVSDDAKVMTLPGLIYKTKEQKETYNSTVASAEEKWTNGVRMLEIPHHHLQPAVEGVQLSYFGKDETKLRKTEKSESGSDE